MAKTFFDHVYGPVRGDRMSVERTPEEGIRGMRREEPDGNVLAGLAFGMLLSAPVWVTLWLLFKFCLG